MKKPRANSPSEDDSCHETAVDTKAEREAESQNNYHWRPWEIQAEDKIGQPSASVQVDPPGDYGLIALECVSECVSKSDMLESLLMYPSLDARMQ